MKKSLKIAFYTEAGKNRGLGHLIRCYTIYQKFVSLGFSPDFYLESDLDLSHKFDDIHYFHWESLNIEHHNDVIFIDSYTADLSTYNTISKSCKVAVYIDDFKRLPYPKGIILNISPDADDLYYKEKVNLHTYLLGLDYIPIRESFLSFIPVKKKQLFIMLGGSDTAHLTTTITKSLKDIDIKKVVVTNKPSDLAELNQLENIKVLFQPTDKELIAAMGNSSAAISTASMSVYELAYLKTPTIAIAVAKNQEQGVNQLINNHIVSACVSIKNDRWLETLEETVTNLLSKSEYTSTDIIDGKGTARVVNEVLKLTQ